MSRYLMLVPYTNGESTTVPASADLAAHIGELALKAHGVIDRHARSRIGVQRHVRRGPLAAAVDLAVLCKARLSGGSCLIRAAPAAATAPARLAGESSAAIEVQRRPADRDHIG